jgi:hypothetical protein
MPAQRPAGFLLTEETFIGRSVVQDNGFLGYARLTFSAQSSRRRLQPDNNLRSTLVQTVREAHTLGGREACRDDPTDLLQRSALIMSCLRLPQWHSRAWSTHELLT